MVYVSRPRSGPGAYTAVAGARLFLSSWPMGKEGKHLAAARFQSLYLNFPGPGGFVVFMA